MGSFKRGLFFGSMLGAGLAWLNLTKSGKETRAKLLDSSEKVYSDIKSKVQTSDLAQNITENKYLKLVTENVELYAKKFGLDDKTRMMLTKILASQWKNLQNELKQTKK